MSSSQELLGARGVDVWCDGGFLCMRCVGQFLFRFVRRVLSCQRTSERHEQRETSQLFDDAQWILLDVSIEGKGTHSSPFSGVSGRAAVQLKSVTDCFHCLGSASTIPFRSAGSHRGLETHPACLVIRHVDYHLHFFAAKLTTDVRCRPPIMKNKQDNTSGAREKRNVIHQ